MPDNFTFILSLCPRNLFVPDGNCSVSEVRSDKLPQKISQDNDNPNGCDQGHSNRPDGSKPQEVEQCCSNETVHSTEELSDSHILLCSEDALRLYSLKTIIQVLYFVYFLFKCLMVL